MLHLPNVAALALLSLLAGCAGAGPREGMANAEDLKVAGVELAGGNPGAALQIAQKLLAANPRDATALVLAGQAQAALGQTEVAGASFAQALSLSPGLLDASLGLARLKLAANPADATTAFAALLRRRSEDARLWTDLGVSYDLQSRPAEAQAAYRHAMLLNPALLSAQADLGLSLALSGQPAKGVALLQPLAAGPEATARLRQDLALAESLAGNASAARSLLAAELPPAQTALALCGYAALAER